MEKLNRAQKCSILGPQNLGSKGSLGPWDPLWICTWSIKLVSNTINLSTFYPALKLKKLRDLKWVFFHTLESMSGSEISRILQRGWGGGRGEGGVNPKMVINLLFSLVVPLNSQCDTICRNVRTTATRRLILCVFDSWLVSPKSFQEYPNWIVPCLVN